MYQLAVVPAREESAGAVAARVAMAVRARDASIAWMPVYAHFDGIRYYQYTVEVSTDNKAWTQVVDASKNTSPRIWSKCVRSKPASNRRPDTKGNHLP